ncbi:DUF2971 domain-containing protein [Alloalcanivorax mobilis]|uniref:DUF2971 domain-containing protein n=1 Tax=Alloalcanivorax mobilis TaxID=2019569 RepID=UPI0012FFE6B4|nr:DUF2971 domain-containing protein [Alloalcanivorax mobilis]
MPYYSLPSRAEIKQYLLKRGVKREKLKDNLDRARNHFFESQEMLSKDDEWREGAGILCLTPYNDNLLMWSHYGDQHKGVCLGFDVALPFDEIFGAGYDVEYSETYPQIPVLRMEELLVDSLNGYKNIDGYDDVVTKQFYTKAECWSYEQEIRFLRPALAHGVGSMPFPAIKLREVILGCNIEESDRIKTMNLVKKNFPHAKILQSKMEEKYYKVKYEEIAEVEKC